MSASICTRREGEVKVTNCCTQKPYLTLQLPGNTFRVEKISITLSSHDQGFCSDPNQVGTLGFTWFELNVETNGARNYIPRKCVYQNPAGIPEWSDTRLEFDCTNDRDGFRDFAAKIKPYDVIQLIPRAQFDAWMNYIRRAELIELGEGLPQTTRSLKLYPGERGDPIVVALAICVLDPKSGPQPQFEALSYCWGELDNNSEEPICVLEEDGNTSITHVSRNLFKALLQLRNTTTTRLLWVDQLCINQADKKELSEQVGIMGTIYSQAARVLIWLGEGDLEVEWSIDEVNRLFPYFQEATAEEIRLGTSRGYLPNLGSHLPLIDVTRLLSLPWFWRVWVVQEAVRATERTFMYGSRTLDWDVIQKANIWTHFEGFEMPGYPHIVLPSIWSSVHVGNATKAESSPTTLDDLNDTRHFDKRLELELFNMFICGLDLRASDPRDYIFGLFGLCNELRETRQSRLIIPDYSKSISDAFIDFTAHYLRHDLRVLSAIHALKGRTWRSLGDKLDTSLLANPFDGRHKPPPSDHPTWALWYDGRTEWANETLGLFDRYHVTGNSKLLHLAYREENRKQMHLAGHRLGELISIGPYSRPLDPRTDISIAFTRLFDKSPERHFHNFTGLGDSHLRNRLPKNPQSHWRAHLEVDGLPEVLPCTNDCYFQTTNGMCGLCPAGTEAGDVLVIFYGGPVPYLLRETEFEGQYTFVGECFVEGKMEQNLLLPFEQAGAAPEGFILV
ncbi:HET-domain-containing protein [Pyrenochaeta sp. DS3sAY3a]|nr:HET-domain-containing protein [Pyrenochaeta sp. DS3sAY3a]